MQATYCDIHRWLDGRDDATGFRIAPTNKDAQDIRGVGKLFHIYFPTHYFKVASSLREVITYDVLKTWIEDSGRICVVDVGCGTGAASSAFIEAIVKIIAESDIVSSVNLHLIGVDPNRIALEFYRAILNRISRSSTIPSQLKISHEIICEKILDGALELQAKLQKLRNEWNQPYIPETLLLQVNVIRPLANQISDVAKAYHQVFTSTPMDRIHSFTIGTRGWENQIKNMQYFLKEHFSRHVVYPHRMNAETHFLNPECSYYRNKGRTASQSNYHVTYSSIQSESWHGDGTWQKIISPENVEQAWARARTALLRESLVDEAEIRIFDQNVTKFIGRLQRRLIAYAEDIFHPQDHMTYELPKNETSFRPKSLSRFEEEILSVAIIQAAGDKYAKVRSIYAFRLNQVEDSKSEFLYKFWGEGFEEYVSDALKAAQSVGDGIVIQTDLSSYYTRISQEKLIETMFSEMLTESKRVEWLLKKILRKELHSEYHEIGYGLAQGGVGSGYYANVYLADLDDFFLQENPLGVSYHRYADDMTIVVPNVESKNDVLAKLDELLTDLELQRSDEKTNQVPCSDYENNGFSPALDKLNLQLNISLKVLWVAAVCYYKDRVECSENLYSFLKDYQQRLRALEMVVPISMLRRKLMKYLNLHPDQYRLQIKIDLPEFGEPNQAQDWAYSFSALNPEWIRQIDSLRDQFEQIVKDILHIGRDNYNKISREDGTRLRFSISRLCRVGMSEYAVKLIAELLNVHRTNYVNLHTS